MGRHFPSLGPDVTYAANEKLPRMVRATAAELQIERSYLPESAKAAETIRPTTERVLRTRMGRDLLKNDRNR